MSAVIETKKIILIVGTGPSALMAADILSSAGLQVILIDKKRGPGRKFLIAGSSGLNVTNALPLAEFASQYSGSAPKGFWNECLQDFTPEDWIQYVQALGSETFLGTSGRYFVREMKASKLLRAWILRLHAQGCQFHFSDMMTDWDRARTKYKADRVLLALGGASYENSDEVLSWIDEFHRRGIRVNPFQPSNVAYQVEWPRSLLEEAEGLPLKNIELTTDRGQMKGELVITRFGLEGTPIYTLGTVGRASINLKPDLTPLESLKLCQSVRENWSPFRRVQKKLNLSHAALSLLFHLTTVDEKSDLKMLLDRLHSLPIQLLGPGPMERAISSRGGVDFSEVNPHSLELLRAPGIHVTGEMLDWDAPTGGFLIQGSVSLGVRAARGLLNGMTG